MFLVKPLQKIIKISVEDYYDAVKEDEELNKKEKLKEDETSSALHLMTALQTNINPLFPILENRNREDTITE
ncbi:hypothetical protein Mgra_00006434 [Meloidogyne graminicola]|uniref:Uncharacterized protein n=1 Tax=Meloidogyne graminicola TaxID=189291 RepID=A0A8S9ZM02_9BILA|nr:hypothetical protein Mgra_00006434 [Meloidogyne graminicola]